MLYKLVIGSWFIVMVLVVCPEIGWACPNCKNAVADNSDGMALGYAWSIALMLTVPLAIVSTWAVVIRRAIKSASRQS